MDLWLEAQDPIARARNREIERKRKDWGELKDALAKLKPLFYGVLADDLSSSDFAGRASTLVPDQELREKAFDWYYELLNIKPEDIARERAEVDEAIRKQAVKDKLHRDQQTILNALLRIFDTADAGKPNAAEALLQISSFALGLLAVATSNRPQEFKAVAAKYGHWPVLASTEAGWEKKAVSEIEELELGKDLTKLRSKFRQVRGADVALPGRRWAKAAVRVIDHTRWGLRFFLHIMNELGGPDEWAEFAVTRGWDIETYPGWVSAAMKLKPFSVATVDDWKVVVREIIREQVPDFHLRPEWATQRATAAANGRDTPGEIQNAILDDIVSALKRLAPSVAC